MEIVPSNQVRSVYEHILKNVLPNDYIKRYTVNKHISIGRCRMIAINESIPLPSEELTKKYIIANKGQSTKNIIAIILSNKQLFVIPSSCDRFEKDVYASGHGFCSRDCESCLEIEKKWRESSREKIDRVNADVEKIDLANLLHYVNTDT